MLQISTTHLTRKRVPIVKGQSKYRRFCAHPRHIRKKLLASGRPYWCEICHCRSKGFTRTQDGWLWNGKPITLQVDHIYGVDFEGCDALDCIQWACALCHGQQATSITKRIQPHSYRIPPKSKDNGKWSWKDNPAKELRSAFNNPQNKHIINLVDSGRQYVCAHCNCDYMDGISDPDHGFWHWNGLPTKLEVNHIHGRMIPNADNAESCEWACANCHWQHTTETRKQRMKERKNGVDRDVS